ncbi:hypothetical protein KOR34_05840 [Posidoniimonas corsicana]|uniref:Autotransporter-associated beta strand repeat protein n=1 Tax=Posidoniimonas corsicana TaxID=1938618 RepID=A0A5C5VCE1_9BACT|nr:hypothetical protein [Posidoniimonas corsicana]TWT35690.1 hypothetical protein KOR34_05840 [Posidoniimonas corsicana]
MKALPRASFVLPLALLIACPANHGAAATRTWIGGNNDWNSSGLNWTGLDEPDDNDDAVFNTNNHVEMAQDNEVLSLDLSGSIELDTETFYLDVNGDITLSGAGTVLRAGESNVASLPATSVSAYNLTINANATYANANFTSIIHPTAIGLLSIEAGGVLAGHGLIRNGDGVASAAIVFSNDGLIRPGSVVDGIVLAGGSPTPRTLTLAAIDSDARIDLDGNGGNGGNGAIDITRNQTLDIDLDIIDPFDGVINLGHNATLDIEDAWAFSGTMTVGNGFVPGNLPFIAAIPADVAYLRGGAITMSSGLSPTTIEVADPDGTLQFDAPFTATGGTIANNGRVIFNQDATVGAGVDFQMLGVDAGLTVGPGATVVINDANMDFDGGGASTNEIIVEADGRLELNLESFEGNDRADGFLTLNSGDLDLTVADGSWTMERRLTLNNSTGESPRVLGSAMVVGDDAIVSQSNDADVRVEGTGTSQINVPVTWNSDAELDVAAGATLAVLGFSTFNSVNGAENAQFNGPGDVYFSGGQVNESTTLNFSGGVVSLDGGGAEGVILLGAPDFTIDAPLVINAAELADYGRSVNFPTPQTSELTINANLGGRLDVNLDDPNASWTVNSSGVVHVNGDAGFFDPVITGSDLNMNGQMNVDGLSRLEARVTIGATGVISFNDAAASIRLSGGDAMNPNRIEGGQVNGLGVLASGSTAALYGFGTIDADIDFNGPNSELRADDGTLTLGGAITDIGEIGTADDDGVLDVTNPWTLGVDSVAELRGGELTGATITNDGLIVGRGLVSARIVNNTVTGVSGGGTLVVDTPANNNNWDGALDTGTLRALGGGRLELHDNADFGYEGQVVANGGTVATVGFAFNLAPASTLTLADGGVLESLHATDIGGAVTVNGAAPSTLAIDGAVIQSTSVVNLNADLRLEGDTRVEPGAAFAGGGALINAAGQTLTLLDGADVDVLVQNEGRVALGASPGQTSGTDFEQTAAGMLEIELQGTGLNQYDRMALTGLAQLDGELELSLIGGFNPVLNDAFTILTATSVAGAFASEDFSLAPLGAGLAWDVVYNPTNVQVVVVEAALLPGDYNEDGVVDAADYTVWRDNVGAPAGTLANDPVGGVIGDAQYNAWRTNYGAVAAIPAAAAAVPEPTAVVTASVLALMGIALRRKDKRSAGN